MTVAGVTIVTLTGDNGLLTKAGQAKKAAEIGEEKEKIQLSYIDYQKSSRIGQAETLNVEGATVTGNGPWTITFPSERTYTLSADGKTITDQIQSDEEKTTITIGEYGNNSGEKIVSLVTGKAIFNSSAASNVEISNLFEGSQSEFYRETLDAIIDIGGLTNVSSSFEENDELFEYCPIFIQNYEKKYGDGLFSLKTDTVFQDRRSFKSFNCY